MNYSYSKYGLRDREKRKQRLFEILPGFVSWSILITLTFVSFTKPLWAAIFILAFLFYWLLRIFYMTFFLLISYAQLASEAETDWMARIHGLRDIPSYLNSLRNNKPQGIKAKISYYQHRKKIEQLHALNIQLPAEDQIYHLVIIPAVKELREVLEPGVKSLIHQIYPASRLVVILAVEDRAQAAVKEGAENLKSKYAHHFLDFQVCYHPDGLPGEARVKGANISFAAKKAADFFRKKHISFENVIVSCFDADTVVKPNYFSCLTYHFMSEPDRTRASFQPIPVFDNNIWDAPGFTRVLEMGSSFFQLIEATNTDALVTFSSHSMSFKALTEIGYWPIDMISDDSAIFWKAYIHYDGNYRVVPMNVTVSMDAVCGENWMKTVEYVYKQKRRWAWGVENFPLVARAFLKTRKIPLLLRIKHLFKMLEMHVSWATWGFLLTALSWFPALAAGREFSGSVLYYNSPKITGVIINLSSIALLISIILSLSLLPKTSLKFPLLRRVLFALEWLFIPFIILLLNTIPALDAQTRLMLGRNMEFWVTQKNRPA